MECECGHSKDHHLGPWVNKGPCKFCLRCKRFTPSAK